MSVKNILFFSFVFLLFVGLFYFHNDLFFGDYFQTSITTTYDREQTTLKKLKTSTEGKSVSITNPPYVTDEGTIDCGDYLAFGEIEKGADSGPSGVTGALDKIILNDLAATQKSREYLDTSPYYTEVADGETFLDVATRVSQEQSDARRSIYTEELKNNLRITANGYERARLCEKLYYSVVASSFEIDAQHFSKVFDGWNRLKLKTNSK